MDEFRGLPGGLGSAGRDGQRRAVLLSRGRGGGWERERLCGGYQQPHDPEGDARRGGDARWRAARAAVGSADGTGSAARFYSPCRRGGGQRGNVYVADTSNHTIRKITPAGVVTTLAGSAGSSGSADGTGSAARFYYPSGVAVDSAGNVYVADTRQPHDPQSDAGGSGDDAGRAARAASGSADGTGSAARFYYPMRRGGGQRGQRLCGGLPATTRSAK